MITENDIQWGKYDPKRDGTGWEGPFFRGTIRYEVPDNPDFEDKVVAVIAATEGCYDSINMYDSCILSVGIMQWCERLGLVSKNLLGPCAEVDEDKLNEFFIAGMPTITRFRKNDAGRWLFFWPFANEWIDTEARKRTAFLGDATVGRIGSWTSQARSRAKMVAAAMANIWSHEPFRRIQIEEIKKRLPDFVPPDPDLSSAFVTYNTDADLERWSGALRAMYYSFAANLPAVAVRSIRRAWAHPDWKGADKSDQFRLAAEALTFGPNISIYPKRYTAIAPVIAQLFSVAIPLNADELKTWEGAPPEEICVNVTQDEHHTACRHTPDI